MDRIENAIKASLIRPELNALYPETEQGRRHWLTIVSPSAILPGDWSAAPEDRQVYVHANPACGGHFYRGHYPALEWSTRCSYVRDPYTPR